MIYLLRQLVFVCLLLMANSVKSQDTWYLNKTSLYNNTDHSHLMVETRDLTGKSSPYDIDRDREIVILGAGGILGITGLAIISNITPLTMEEIYNLDAADINGFDRNAVGPYSDYLAGDFLVYGSLLLPLTFITNNEMKRDWKILGIMGVEVLLVQAGLNTVLKGITQRKRPYVYDPETSAEKKTSKDAVLSFYSGHTSTAAAMSFFTAKVFSDYLPNGTAKSMIWTGAVLYPALVGYLRVATANHFPTDVIVGYTVGAMIGYFIPELHKVGRGNGLSVYPSLNYNQFSVNALYSF